MKRVTSIESLNDQLLRRHHTWFALVAHHPPECSHISFLSLRRLHTWLPFRERNIFFDTPVLGSSPFLFSIGIVYVMEETGVCHSRSYWNKQSKHFDWHRKERGLNRNHDFICEAQSSEASPRPWIIQGKNGNSEGSISHQTKYWMEKTHETNGEQQQTALQTYG